VTDQPLEPEESEQPTVSKASPAQEEPEVPASEPSPDTETEITVAPQRQLVRSRDDRVIAGVCGGLGKHWAVDPVLIRIAALLLVFAGGAGIVLYIVGWIAIPEEPEDVTVATPSPPAEDRTRSAVALGVIFIVLGAVFLADAIWPDFLSWRYVWPIALIVIGAAILLRSRK
jgi:phage shock protein PspC (stress-responsive transcriptional regulator)